MKEHIRPALTLLIAFTILTGFAYPFVVTGIASLYPGQRAQGDPHLIGREFTDPGYFWGRRASGSNLGPLNPKLRANAEARIAALRAADPQNTAPIPVDLVTASASGLDPHISPEAAEYQVARVARARGVSEETIRALVHSHTESRSLGFLGEPRVNVVELNLELDASLRR